MLKKVLVSLLLTSALLNFSCATNEKHTDVDTLEIYKSKNTRLADENLTSEQKNVVYKYAPIIFQETNVKENVEKRTNWDFVTAADFDNDLIGNNNEESLRSGKFKLPANVYFALVETKTHYFITYSLFHPLDWSTSSPAIPYNWHENDMENLQVVVKKATAKDYEKVILLSTQAHLNTEVYPTGDSGVTGGEKQLDMPFVKLLGDNADGGGTHAGVYVEWGGHGIYNMDKKRDKFTNAKKLKLKEGFTFMPSRSNTPDYYQDGKSEYMYQLKPIHDTFWKYYVEKTNMGDGKLLDGTFDYADELVNYKNLPRHFDSNRVSGPGKTDAGILSFAISYSLSAKDLGVLFFNPAKKYANTLKISGDFSKEYVYNPYILKN
ncbi:MAG: hypothetical protein U0457_09735 [Candidatus Sericytochromatia bacterium]